MDPQNQSDGIHPLSEILPVAILGMGRLGTHLAVHLYRSLPPSSSPQTIRLWNRSPLSPERLSPLQEAGLPVETCLETGPHPTRSLGGARLLVLTVADDAITGLAARLAAGCAESPAAGHRPGTRPAVLHTSGTLSARALSPLRRVGCAVGSCHPLQSFSGNPHPEALRGTFFAVEGDAPATYAATILGQALGGRIVPLAPDGKLLYHTSAVVASNLLVALVSEAVLLLEQATAGQASPQASLEMLLPLIEGTVRNLRSRGLPAALTGPVSRGDAAVVRRQLEQLGARPGLDPALPVLYRELSRRALELARAQGLDLARADAVEAVLQETFVTVQEVQTAPEAGNTLDATQIKFDSAAQSAIQERED